MSVLRLDGSAGMPYAPGQHQPDPSRRVERERFRKRLLDSRRGNSAERGYDHRWRSYRERYLRDNPLCVECLRLGRLVPASVVDHIADHHGDYALFWAVENHQALCAPCHNAKTARSIRIKNL